MSLRSLFSRNVFSQGRVVKSHSRRGPRRITLEPLEKRSLLSAVPTWPPAADFEDMDPADNVAITASYADGANEASFLVQQRDAADGSVDTIFSSTDEPPSEITDAEREAARQAARETGGPALLAGFTRETSAAEGEHLAVTRYVFTLEEYTFANSDPLADAGGDYSIAEGESLALDASASSDADGDSLSYSWDINGDGVYGDVTGAQPTLGWSDLESFKLNSDGTYSIAVEVADGYGGVARDTAELIVENAGPTASIELNTTAGEDGYPEGSPIRLSGSATDPNAADPLSLVWSVTKNGEAYGSGEGVDFEFTPDDNGAYEVTLTATDDDGGVGAAASTIEVVNAAPSILGITLDSPAMDEDGQVTVSGTFMDPGLADAHTLDVVWGDGTASQASVDPGARTFSASHQYEGAGVFAIGLTLHDDDGGSDDASATTYVTGVAVNDGVLQVIGTDGDDFVHLTKLGCRFMVTADFLPGTHHTEMIQSRGIERIEMYLGGGNDQAVVSQLVRTPAMLDGDDGDDFLAGGRGGDVLKGGEGDDVLVGGLGRDLLLGGPGSDWLAGTSPEDVFVSGGHRHVSDAALMALVHEWA